MKRIQRVTGCGGQCKRDWNSETRKVMTAGIQTGVLNLTACVSVRFSVSACVLGVDAESETTVHQSIQ